MQAVEGVVVSDEAMVVEVPVVHAGGIHHSVLVAVVETTWAHSQFIVAVSVVFKDLAASLGDTVGEDLEVVRVQLVVLEKVGARLGLPSNLWKGSTPVM